MSVEAVFRFVGDPDRIIFGFVGDDTQDRAEDLFPSDCYVVRHIDEQGGLYEVTLFETLRMTLAADEHFRTFFNPFADVGLHSLVLLQRHHRADGGLWISRIAVLRNVWLQPNRVDEPCASSA